MQGSRVVRAVADVSWEKIVEAEVRVTARSFVQMAVGSLLQEFRELEMRRVSGFVWQVLSTKFRKMLMAGRRRSLDFRNCVEVRVLAATDDNEEG